ncbi:amino acid ABC transporter substrate-binding protein [Paraglaciecola arctica]|uniref:amino acid ABC transporter substrate-binding protein n=1 Tax=Paraglaciecola arctica TaxID=1128911 RepID=UPI001C07983B|nr:amino acid ABC transporter substrate-binding protein [Paraglaciecola arctica]MBU3003403.1 amino acid ABC transporter substrate-binding protein [Paraglaciecola arctica]
MKRLLVICSVFFSVNALSASWQITYPRHLENSSKIDEYPIQVLALALEQTGVKYQLNPSENILSKGKALVRLQDNREINIVWGMTNPQREKDLLPIRIPIFKGLIGWRLLLIRQDMAGRFKYIQELEHLVKLAPLQGRDWPDTKVLQSNSFDVVTERSQSALMKMLGNAQGDFYPRSIIEIWDELDKSQSKIPIRIQPTLGIRYPAAIYFFVNKNSVPLASLIENGLEKAIKNGKFDALFIENYKPYIDKAQLEKRTFYTLKNTFLPEKTPLDRKELWFDGKIDAAIKP